MSPPQQGDSSSAENAGDRRRVVDGTSLSSPDSGVALLGNLEGSLEDFPSSSADKAGDKVELDKADLPLDMEPEPAPAPSASQPVAEIEVDLSEEAEAEISADLETGDQAPGKSKKRILILAAGLFGVVLMAAGLGLWYGHRPDPGKKAPEKPKDTPVFTAKVPDYREELVFTLDPFVVPLLESKRGRILHVKVSLETMGPEGKLDLARRTRQVRDIIYRVLRIARPRKSRP